jgi:myo-inositol-1(or 4)-monophosphatase
MEFLSVAEDIARAAGEILKYYASRDKRVELKGLGVADRESEEMIVREIRARYPDHGILAEESGLVAASAATALDRWIIDPLDGTTNYAHQFPMYSVSIGFERAGELLCGAVYDPVRDEMFTGSRGGGAFLNGEPISVSHVSSLSDGLLLTGFPYEFREKVGRALDLFRSFLIGSQAVRRAGSAALDLCYIASGRCDGFWELDLQPWDTAAGTVIVEEAGGRVTDFSGNPFRVESKEILASNGQIHNEMVVACSTKLGPD